jgi:hypothetical protein
MLNLSKDVILSHIDFAKYYTNEIQPMHWHSFQVMIPIHITYKLNPSYNENNGQTRMIKKSHFYVNDDK